MGKKIKPSPGLGRALIKDHHRKLRERRSGMGNSFLHTADLQDGQDLCPRSITEQNSLDEFLATAELAGRNFTAERQSCRLITGGMPVGLLTQEEEGKIERLHATYRDSLRIPRRPQWDRDMSKEDLETAEKEAFLNWRRALAMLEEKEHIVMTPYEKNLSFWRQLWRVVEKSDVIVQIVDARNPLLFWCQDLEVYVKEVDANKTNLLMINKADYLSHSQREKWADYFAAKNVKVVFWSAQLESERLAKMEKNANDSTMDDSAATVKEWSNRGDDKESEQVREVEEDKDSDEEEELDDTSAGGSAVKADNRSTEEMESPVTQCSTHQESDCQATECSTATASSCEAGDTSSKQAPDGAGTSASAADSQATGGADCTPAFNSPHILSGPELLKFLQALHSGVKVQAGTTTVGLVGYPNVGKSSTINAILNMKKVPVSATPGRTKHFQTLYVDRELLLCDCPGLVFPSFVSTKGDLIVNGVLPIDQMRDFRPPCSLVCRHIPREVLEDIYGVMLPVPLKERGEDPSRPPTADELLSALATMRGYFSSKGNPDCSRAARCLLKDYLSGKLLYCHAPPGVSAPEFQMPYALRHPDRTRHHQQQQLEKAQKAFHDMEGQLFEDFQSRVRLSARSKGVQGHGVEFVRTEGLRQVVAAGQPEDEDGEPMADGASVAGSSSSVSATGKPWKKHHNRNKKEKLRRKFGDTFYTT